jgi:hypothetical protein
MKKPLLLFTFCYFLITNGALIAQSEQHFRASVAAGVNLSQIEGDVQQGYHKLGAALGAKAAYCFKPNFDMSAELLYNSRGCRSNPFEPNPTISDRTVGLRTELNYADILIASNFHFSPNNAYTFYRQSLQLGVSYGRLLTSKITALRGTFHDIAIEEDLQNTIKKDDIGLVVGYSWFLTPRLGITTKHTVSLRKIYVNPKTATSNTLYKSFAPYNISVQLTYNFIAPKLNIKGQVEKAKKAAERKKRNPLEDL